MLVLDRVLNDRGSRYAVTLAAAADRAAAQAVVADLCRKGKFRRATHHSWALLTAAGDPVGDDDGEAGAAAIIRQEIEAEGLCGVVVIVTRWFGGTHLGGDRFRHIRSATRTGLAAWRALPADG